MNKIFGIFSNSNNQKYKINLDTAILLKEKFYDKVVIIDVRTPEEYKTGHIQGSINVQAEIINNYKKLKYDNLYILYCRSGRRADSARTILESKGYTSLSAGGVINFDGKLVE